MNDKEQKDFNEIADRLNKVREYLKDRNLSSDYSDIDFMIEDFVTVKDMLGNLNAAINFLTLQKAKIFLEKKFNQPLPDLLLKHITSPGLKINYILSNGERVIAEAKTISPIGRSFGSNQKDEIRKVLERLKNENADYKFLFVTNYETANILHIQYSMDLVGITVEII